MSDIIDNTINYAYNRSGGEKRIVDMCNMAYAELARLRAELEESDKFGGREHEAKINAQRERNNAINQSEKLRAALTQAREALKPFAEIPCLENFDDDQNYDFFVIAGDVRKARAALDALDAVTKG